jgi:hypothetical protein
MRFAKAVDVNAYDRSAGGYKFASETPKSFFALIGDANLDRVALTTDKATYSISGLDTYSLMRPGRISQFGSASPKTFSTRREFTYWLDDARRIHSYPSNPELDRLSINVKDILDGISTANGKLACSAVFDDRYYMFYAPSGQSVNNAAIVVDLISGTLTRDTYTVGVASAIVNGSRLLAFMSDGTMRQLESSTPATVTGVSVVSRELGTANDSWMAGRQRIYSDGAAATTATLTWTPYKVGAAGAKTTTMSLAPSAGETRTDTLCALGTGVKGRSIQMEFSGNMPSGTKFYAWQVEADGRVQEAGTS